MNASDYIEINKALWNGKTEIHYKSDFYDVEGFINGKSSLNSIELDILGDISNLRVLHLQCHFGQDSISLARLGADVVGVDFSDKAIATAQELASRCQVETHFICCDIYDLPHHLEGQFDIVFTSYGTIGWLPDLERWASIISHYLKPSGRFVFAEFHPVVWMFDDNFKNVSYSYFNTGAIVESEEGTYADKEANIKSKYVCWNHSISEVVNALINEKLQLHQLNEYNYSPYNCFNEMIELAPRQYRIKHLGNKLPMVYALEAVK